MREIKVAESKRMREIKVTALKKIVSNINSN